MQGHALVTGAAGFIASWDNSQWALDANVMATKKLLNAMVRVETEARLVFAPSLSVYGAAEGSPTSETKVLKPISQYGVTKVSAEQLINAFTRWIRAALGDRPLTVYGDGFAVRDFTSVSDVVGATTISLDIPACPYNVVGGSPASVSEAIEVIQELTRGTVNIEHMPNPRSDPPRTGGDVSRLPGVSSWRPAIELRKAFDSRWPERTINEPESKVGMALIVPHPHHTINPHDTPWMCEQNFVPSV